MRSGVHADGEADTGSILPPATPVADSPAITSLPMATGRGAVKPEARGAGRSEAERLDGAVASGTLAHVMAGVSPSFQREMLRSISRLRVGSAADRSSVGVSRTWCVSIAERCESSRLNAGASRARSSV